MLIVEIGLFIGGWRVLNGGMLFLLGFIGKCCGCWCNGLGYWRDDGCLFGVIGEELIVGIFVFGGCLFSG